MKNPLTILPIVSLLLLAAGYQPAAAQECDEFISTSACRVSIPITSVAGPVTPQYRVAAPIHSDVQINSGAAVVTVLQQASPFLACTIAAVPAAPTRDLSTNIAAALTTVGGLVLFSAPQPFSFSPGANAHAELMERLNAAPPPSPAEAALAALEVKIAALSAIEQSAFNDLSVLYKLLNQDLSANWRYSFPTDAAANAAVAALASDLANLINQPVPNLVSIDAQTKKIQDDLAAFYTTYAPPAGSPLALLAAQVAGNVNSAAGNAGLLDGGVSDFKKKVKQYIDFIAGIPTVSTPGGTADITLPMAPYRQKAVTETITCKDALNSATQPFDSIVFTAYYENTPRFDISPGVIVSSLPGRQVGAVSGPLGPGPALTPPAVPPTGVPCGPSNPSETCLGITSSTPVQFMPAAFFEYHPINKKCPWAVNGAQRHPFGYVCSLGLVGGFSVNPNNGTASAEFFEGVSVGIQRLSIMFGIHNGRYQTFTDGYFAGEAVPAGTVARTERNLTNHFAIGIAYRTVLR